MGRCYVMACCAGLSSRDGGNAFGGLREAEFASREVLISLHRTATGFRRRLVKVDIESDLRECGT